MTLSRTCARWCLQSIPSGVRPPSGSCVTCLPLRRLVGSDLSPRGAAERLGIAEQTRAHQAGAGLLHDRRIATERADWAADQARAALISNVGNRAKVPPNGVTRSILFGSLPIVLQKSFEHLGG